jgi:hypothetical protein
VSIWGVVVDSDTTVVVVDVKLMETELDVKLELLIEVVIDCCDNVEADWLDVIDDSRDEVDVIAWVEEDLELDVIGDWDKIYVVIVVVADGLEVLVEVDEVDVITGDEEAVEEAIELDVTVEVWGEMDVLIVDVWDETDDLIVVEVTTGLEEIDDEVDAVEEALELDVLEDCWEE